MFLLIVFIIISIIALFNTITSSVALFFMFRMKADLAEIDSKEKADEFIKNQSGIMKVIAFKEFLMFRLLMKLKGSGVKAANALTNVLRVLIVTTVIRLVISLSIVILDIAFAFTAYSLYLEYQSIPAVITVLFDEEADDDTEEEGWSWDAADGGVYSGTTGKEPGTAEGQYAIKLDDGSFFWFHQTKENCDYNFKNSYGYFGNLKSGPSNKKMSSRGCAIYSTATAMSNILGTVVSPYDIMEGPMGCTISKVDSGYKVASNKENNGINYDGDSVSMDMNKFAELLNNYYSSAGVIVEVVSFDQATLDSYFDDDSIYTYVINSYQNTDGGLNWYRNGGKGHFMVLRGKDSNGNYLCFTSSTTMEGSSHENIVKSMNTGLSWDVVSSHAKHSECIVIHRSKSYYNTSSSGTATGGTTGGTPSGAGERVYEFYSGGNFDCPYRTNCFTFEGWQMITAASSAKTWRDSVYPNWQNGKNAAGDTSAFDSEGFGKAEGRYVVAVTNSNDGGIGKPGDKLDVYLQNGQIIQCIVGDAKSSGDSTWTKWGHIKSTTQVNTIEFCVNRGNPDVPMWYTIDSSGAGSPNHANPGTSSCHSEWNSDIVKIVVNPVDGSTTATTGINSNPVAVAGDENYAGTQMAEYAVMWVGSHYVWGGTTLGCTDWTDGVGVDCSGFTMVCASKFGVSLPHSAYDQRSRGTEVDKSSVNNLLPGDIVCYNSSGGNGYHVGIYIGNGQIVHASSAKTGVKISAWDYKTPVTVRRLF